MSLPDFVELPIIQIVVPEDRARSHDPAWSKALAHIIAQQGLIHPITVRRVGEGWVLVSGLHRLRAFEALGLGMIPARLSQAASEDAARLEEVMENLGRNELNALDRCHHLAELKQVWERLHPETRAGVAGGKARQGSANEIFSFAAATAERIGLSQRAIQISVKIWTDLSPISRHRLVGTDLAGKQSELKALSEETPAMQAQILDLILGERRLENVAQALEFLSTGIVLTAPEKRFQAFSRSFAALDEDMFDFLLEVHEVRVIAALQRRGRI